MSQPFGWRQPAQPERAPADQTQPFAPVAGSLVACALCGAVVDSAHQRLHASWHTAQHHHRVPVTVQGVTAPADAREPARSFEVTSGFPRAEALERLRDWAAGEGADLSFRQPTGFRATFNGRGVTWSKPENVPVRLAVAADPDDDVRGCRLTVLIVPAGMLGYGSPYSTAAGQVFEARFDQMESAIVRLVERR